MITQVLLIGQKKNQKKWNYSKKSNHISLIFIHQLERQGADIQSKINELELLNISMRERDRMKDDIISRLSDRLLTLSERIELLEKDDDIVILGTQIKNNQQPG